MDILIQNRFTMFKLMNITWPMTAQVLYAPWASYEITKRISPWYKIPKTFKPLNLGHVNIVLTKDGQWAMVLRIFFDHGFWEYFS